MSFSLTACSAVITGASSGLGAEFARQLAPHARVLVLAARREELLSALKAELTAQHKQLVVHCVPVDLVSQSGVKHLVDAVEVLDVRPNLLINNAGMGDYGSFTSASAERLHQQMQLNMHSLVMLTHALLPLLSRPGGVVNVSSLAGNLPMPDLAVYAATKSFVTSFSEALHIELKKQGVTVTAVCPGPTPTEFSRTARREGGDDTNRSGQGLLRILPQQVVAEGLRALTLGHAVVFPGRAVSLAATLFRTMPRALLRWINARRHSQSAS